MGENMEVNDYVTRKKYNNDIVFKIIRIKGRTCYLKGVDYRLTADADIEDLVKVKYKENKVELELCETRGNQTKKGKVLHLDGDEAYLSKCLDYYRSNKIEAIGIYMNEKDMKNQITNLLIMHKPDVLVITGHDSINEKGEYLNTDNFALCIKNARICMPDKDSLVIFAGACQSEYNKLIESGANFASSIGQSNIHVLDPVLIAIQVASTPVTEYIDVEKVLKRTVSKGKGLGGIDTRGVARRKYGG